ncbi:MAG: hypothetical protein QMD44_01505 [Thermodesulfovibrionales bacterium]|nr:hypothetical protein [Thermodesulfovibrionales bacterium]
MENPITKTTIDDVQNLLRLGVKNVTVSINNLDAHVQIVLSEINTGSKNMPSRFAAKRSYHYLEYPDHEYQWISHCINGKVILKLNSMSYQGISFGLYGLLQEKLGFKFYHPKRTIVPSHKKWPLPPEFKWKASPVFDKKGFHLHTLHPIELAEQLHNPQHPHALKDIKEYIDWLVRNQQNTFQFYLLRDIDRSRWIQHARDFVSYAHKRGILTGVEISMFTLQQNAFQTIKPVRFFYPYKKQIDNTLSWLFNVGWDFVTVDFSMGEYLPDMGRLMPEARDYIVRQISEKYNTKIMFTTHVIPDHADVYMPQNMKTGVLIHTVMFYSIDEPKAPVYGNKNQRFMLQIAIRENKRQETWYWPEAAYWVSFDNSVPLFLLPYLDARWSDMNLMKNIGIDSHITFSSGWEWGYWLIDWSIARWSWEHVENGVTKKSHPLSILNDLFPDTNIEHLWAKALELQNRYLKEMELIRFVSAIDPSAELPWPFNKPFQPRLPFKYKWLLKKASDKEAVHVLNSYVALLHDYAGNMTSLTEGLEFESKRFFSKKENRSPELRLIMDELIRGLKVTALRAEHRALTIKALVSQRKKQYRWQPVPRETLFFLQEASSVRQKAQSLVKLQEGIYRYPIDLIARQRNSLTAYDFGYLYPVSNLFFWEREEGQVRDRRFDAFYMNIWDFIKITGVKSLF